MSELMFEAGAITRTENDMWHLELLGDHRGFFETRDAAIEKALDLLAEKRDYEDVDDGLLVVARDSMEQAIEITEKLCDQSNSAEEGSGLKGIEDELSNLYGLLDNMNSYMGG